MKNQLSKCDFIFITLILLGLIGCQNNSNRTKTRDQHDTIKSAKKTQIARSISGLSCDTTIVNQELSNDALAFNIFKADTNKIKSLFLDPVILKMQKATTEEGEPYYLHNFSDGINKIILLRNDSSFYIKDAEIKNNRVLLNSKISIGMREDIFLQLLKVKNINCDTITVADGERSFESIYIFKDAKLQQIQMGSTVE